MSATCPSCGVAVVAGYTKCPRCQKPLPAPLDRRIQTVAGGTAVDRKPFPVIPVAAGGGGLLLIILFVKVCGGGSSDDKPQPSAPSNPAPAPTIAQTPSQPGPMQNPTVQPSQPAIDPSAATAELDRTLRLKRFWSTIDLRGTMVDVRSGSCDDPAMPGLIDGAAATLRGAGLTRLRCLAQSGVVVFERNL